MKYFLLFIVVMVFNTKTIFAEIYTINLDTIIDKSDYKQSRKTFLNLYGKDDSTKALINYYFNKRGNRLVDAVFLVATNGALILALNHNQKIKQTPDSGYFGLIVVGPLLIATITFTVSFVVQEIKRSILTKRKLYLILDNYNHGNHLPKRIIRKRKFKIELDKVHGKQPNFRFF